MEVEFLPCPTCTQITIVEVPPCADEHGFDCPDRACTMCGTALTVAGITMLGDVRPTTGGRAGVVATETRRRSRSAA